jgi:hypothetical protein
VGVVGAASVGRMVAPSLQKFDEIVDMTLNSACRANLAGAAGPAARLPGCRNRLCSRHGRREASKRQRVEMFELSNAFKF